MRTSPKTIFSKFREVFRVKNENSEQPVLTGNLFGFDQATFNIAMRLEYVDWNKGAFRETGKNIGDDIWAIVPAISFRPTAQTVIRLNYRIMEQTDILGNPPAKISGFQFGISSYF